MRSAGPDVDADRLVVAVNDRDPLEFPDESPPLEQLLVNIGRELRATNRHLDVLRFYAGIVIAVTVVIAVLIGLWLFGVITVDVGVTR